jgi:hypothetical protein
VRQRVFSLACGANCNDAAPLTDDPIHKLLLDRDPLAGPALGSQPTLSRFENAVGAPICIASAGPWPIRSWPSTASASAQARPSAERRTLVGEDCKGCGVCTAECLSGAIAWRQRRLNA